MPGRLRGREGGRQSPGQRHTLPAQSVPRAKKCSASGAHPLGAPSTHMPPSARRRRRDPAQSLRLHEHGRSELRRRPLGIRRTALWQTRPAHCAFGALALVALASRASLTAPAFVVGPIVTSPLYLASLASDSGVIPNASNPARARRSASSETSTLLPGRIMTRFIEVVTVQIRPIMSRSRSQRAAWSSVANGEAQAIGSPTFAATACGAPCATRRSVVPRPPDAVAGRRQERDQRCRLKQRSNRMVKVEHHSAAGLSRTPSIQCDSSSLKHATVSH